MNLDFFDEHQASAWRQRYEDSDRSLRLQQSWGLTGVDYQRARLDASSSMGNEMFGQVQGQQLTDVQSRAFRAYKRDPNLQTAARVIAPAALVYSLSSGQPFSVRLAESTMMFVRTELGFVDSRFRFKTGTFGLSSPILNGKFDFRPLLADTRDPGIPGAGAAVAANAAMGAGGSVDFSLERYQLTVSRGLPVWGLESAVFYGSSSNAVMGSVSKQLFPHVSMAVDSTRWLSATDPSRASEEKVRLRYDIHF